MNYRLGGDVALTTGKGETFTLGGSSALLVEAPKTLGVNGPTTQGPKGDKGDRGDVGPQGPPGTVGINVTADVPINALTVVKLMLNSRAQPASSMTAGDGAATIGVAATGALAGEQFNLRTAGALFTAATLPVGPVYLSTDGSLTSNPNTGLFQLRIGYVPSPHILVVRIDPPIFRIV